jgi:hypothetical protein
MNPNLNFVPYFFEVSVTIAVMYETVKHEKIGEDAINDS